MTLEAALVAAREARRKTKQKRALVRPGPRECAGFALSCAVFVCASRVLFTHLSASTQRPKVVSDACVVCSFARPLCLCAKLAGSTGPSRQMASRDSPWPETLFGSFSRNSVSSKREPVALLRPISHRPISTFLKHKLPFEYCRASVLRPECCVFCLGSPPASAATL